MVSVSFEAVGRNLVAYRAFMGERNDETAESYRSAGFNRQLGFGNHPAVLVIDMCVAYFTAGSPLDLGSTDSIEGCKTLVEAARRAGVPVIWSRVEFEPGGANGGVFYRKVGALASFDRGNPLGDWLPELTPTEGDIVITKQGASAFFGTSLSKTLRDLAIDTLIIGGVSTSGCVRASAIDACQNNVVPIVVPEACGDRERPIHESNLFDIDAKYGDVRPLAEVVEHLVD